MYCNTFHSHLSRKSLEEMEMRASECMEILDPPGGYADGQQRRRERRARERKGC